MKEMKKGIVTFAAMLLAMAACFCARAACHGNQFLKKGCLLQNRKVISTGSMTLKLVVEPVETTVFIK